MFCNKNPTETLPLPVKIFRCVKHLLCIFSALLFVAILAPGQAYACGDSGCKDTKQKQTEAKQVEQKSCGESSDGLASCCENGDTGQAGNHDCNGQCGGKCGGHCTCPSAHSGAVFFGDFLLHFPFSQPVFTGFPYSTPFLSNVSLDIWLPPDIRA